MKVLKVCLETLIVNKKAAGESQQTIENDVKAMLKQKMIDVDDYSNAMEIIYGKEE
jgi:regulatory protein YycI of two-component signal transduction system YycFG